MLLARSNLAMVEVTPCSGRLPLVCCSHISTQNLLWMLCQVASPHRCWFNVTEGVSAANAAGFTVRAVAATFEYTIISPRLDVYDVGCKSKLSTCRLFNINGRYQWSYLDLRSQDGGCFTINRRPNESTMRMYIQGYAVRHKVNLHDASFYSVRCRTYVG